MLELWFFGYFRTVKGRSPDPPAVKIFAVCLNFQAKIMLRIAIISCFIFLSCSLKAIFMIFGVNTVVTFSFLIF